MVVAASFVFYLVDSVFAAKTGFCSGYVFQHLTQWPFSAFFLSVAPLSAFYSTSPSIICWLPLTVRRLSHAHSSALWPAGNTPASICTAQLRGAVLHFKCNMFSAGNQVRKGNVHPAKRLRQSTWQPSYEQLQEAHPCNVTHAGLQASALRTRDLWRGQRKIGTCLVRQVVWSKPRL